MPVQATKLRTEYFWMDYQQTVERLNGSYVVYDGTPCAVLDIQPHEDNVPRLNLVACNSDRTAIGRKKADSPKFNRFRELPKIGWINHLGGYGACFIARRTVTTRTHGLSNTNTVVHSFTAPRASKEKVLTTGEVSLNNLVFDNGFADMHKGVYPTLAAVLEKIRPGTTIAYSRTFAVQCDVLGIKWLYRETKRVGLFGTDSLNLTANTIFLREEIMADPAFTLNTIREL